MSGAVLGIDTATADTAVAVTDLAGTLAEGRVGPGAGGRPRHGPALMGLVEEAVGAAGGWERVGRIAVGIGPGSFTGLRIGVATARALAQGRGLELVGVPSTAALARAIDEAEPGRTPLAVIDARRGEVFAAIGTGPDSEPVVCAPDALGAVLKGVSGALAAGDGSVRFREQIEAQGALVAADDDPVHRISARYVSLLGAELDGARGRDVRPLYLRRPDAERWRERDGGN
jgi:tRNA threonylcarbamoyladenosine biosynthesis protein TsaB